MVSRGSILFMALRYSIFLLYFVLDFCVLIKRAYNMIKHSDKTSESKPQASRAAKPRKFQLF